MQGNEVVIRNASNGWHNVMNWEAAKNMAQLNPPFTMMGTQIDGRFWRQLSVVSPA